MVEVGRNLNEEVLHEKLVLPSSLGKGNRCKTYLGRDVHSKEGMKKFPTSKTGMNLWSTYPCASCGTSNHSMEKFQRRQYLQ
jgi:hypothetical protein